MKKKASFLRILLLAGLCGLLCSCAQMKEELAPMKEEIASLKDVPLPVLFATPSPVPEPTPVPSIAVPEEGEKQTVSFYTPEPTPKRTPAPGKIPLRISEVSVSGDAAAKRVKGVEGEWIELYNASNAPVKLSAYSLSDREDNVGELSLPNIFLRPGLYYLVELKEDGPFGIKPGETVYLFENDSRLYDSFTLPAANGYTCGRNDQGETVYFRYSTPGAGNRLPFTSFAEKRDFELNGVYISEVMATGAEEWIEITNGGKKSVDLSGWHLAREKDGTDALTLAGTLEPGGFFIIEGITLPASGTKLYLTDEKGFFRDTYDTGVLKEGMSSGRDPETGKRLFYAEPTVGAPNAAEGYAGYAPDIAFSVNSLYATEPFTLTLTAPGAEIYYTTDGTAPGENGILYTEPIPVEKSLSVRAVAKREGYMDSPEAVRHFLFEQKHTVPVICVAMDKNDFRKVYRVTERGQVVEKPCSLAYYYADGSQGTSMLCVVKAKGRGSLVYEQKSLSFKLRERFGTNYTEYPLFGPGVNEGIRYRSFCLRAGGQDYNRAIIRDPLINRASRNTAVDAVQTRPAVLYVNGEYMGLFMLQEEMNADYYVSHYGLDKEQLDVINQNGGVRSGTVEGYQAMRKLARGTNGSEEDYAALCRNIDVEAYTDYCAIQLIVGNTDVLNQKVVQSRDGKLLFRPMLFDEDSAYGGRKTDLMYPYFKSAGFTPSSSDKILCNNDVFKALYKNAGWREKFWHRTVELLNTDLSVSNLNGLIDGLVKEIEPEMPRQIKKYKFHASVTAWKDKVADLKSVISGRQSVVYDQLKYYFKISDADIRAYEKELKKGSGK